MNNIKAKSILLQELKNLKATKGSPYTIEALEAAINALSEIDRYKWKLNVTEYQLKELGLSLGQSTDEVQKAIKTSNKVRNLIKELEEGDTSDKTSKKIFKRKVHKDDNIDALLYSLKRLL